MKKTLGNGLSLILQSFSTGVVGFMTGAFLFSGMLSAEVHNLDTAARKIYIEEKISKKINEDLVFTDENGSERKIREFLHHKGRPVVLVPAYYNCTRLCTFVLNGVLTAMEKETGYLPGEDYTVLTVSINPADKADLAAEKKKNYISAISDPRISAAAQKGWHFLTGKAAPVKELMDSVGFHYQKSGNEYEHAASLILIQPDGKINRYLYGIQYTKTDFRMALLESSQGRSLSVKDQLILFCFQYSPEKRHYSVIGWRLMMLGGMVSTVFAIGLVGLLWFREKKGHETRGEEK